KNKVGETVLYTAIEKGYTDIINYLISEIGVDVEKMDNDNNNAIQVALLHQQGNNSLLEDLVKLDVDTERENENGDNTFVSAIKAENIKVIKEMIDKGLDVNNVDKNGDNALHIYFGNKSEHMRLLQGLIKEGTKINAFNSEGFSPLYLAIKNGEGNQVEELMNYPKHLNGQKV